DDDLFLPATKPEIAFTVVSHHVARIEPTVDNCLSRGVGSVPVADHGARGLDPQPAFHVWGNFRAIVGSHGAFVAVSQFADRTDSIFSRGRIEGGNADLRHSVGFINCVAGESRVFAL